MRGRRLGRRVGSARPAPWAGCDQWPAETPPPAPPLPPPPASPGDPPGSCRQRQQVVPSEGGGREGEAGCSRSRTGRPTAAARDLLALPGLLSAR